jgi:RND family efflux transporter MFP subunit
MHAAGWLSAAAVLSACGSAPPTEVEAAEEPAPVVVSQWTERSELFVEFTPLVAGATSRFAIHFTDLATFEPLREGRATVRLTGARVEEFEVDAPGRPGIFGVDVTPAAAGRARLELLLDAAAVQDRHDLGEVRVLTAAEAAALPPEAEEEDGTVPFLKEQQWSLDFATAEARRRPMADSLDVPAEIRPRTGGEAEVTTPVAGRLAADLPPRPVGSVVGRGDTLAQVVPRSEHADDRPALELAVAEARDALELARAGHARVERLVEVGALPARRRLEARLASQTAEARMTAAEAHLAQLDSTRRGEGEGTADTRFVLRAPMRGVVAESAATPGASVDEGARLFKLIAVDRVHVVGALPEAALSRLDDLAGAELEVPGAGAPLLLERLVTVGRVVDEDTRTVPIIYELPNPDRRLAIGQAVTLRVFGASSTDAVTVPESAIVDDGGQPVVFVQIGGESFERRPVRLGHREGGDVQVTGDVAEGDRVVTVGAPLIRLAALSPQAPAHGHTH